MALRSLTDVYILMRNNAFYGNNIYSESRNSDHDSLLQGRNRSGDDDLTQAPPQWIDKFEAGQFVMSKIPSKMNDLEALHKRHLLRPMLSEDTAEEQEIESMSEEITRLISQTYKHIDGLKSYLNVTGGGKEKRLLDNVIKTMLRNLQTVTANYRNAQNNYMRQLTSREKTSSDFFDDLNMKPTDSLSPSNIPVKSFDNFLQQPSQGKQLSTTTYFDNDENVDEFFEIPIANRFSQKQLVLLEQENTESIELREKEVLNVMKSIVQLNDIYKELAHMVQEQGTVLDRIDYNVEITQTKVHQGYEQLKKAEFYQRKSRKLFCITILATITLVMLVLLLITKL